MYEVWNLTLCEQFCPLASEIRIISVQSDPETAPSILRAHESLSRYVELHSISIYRHKFRWKNSGAMLGLTV